MIVTNIHATKSETSIVNFLLLPIKSDRNHTMNRLNSFQSTTWRHLNSKVQFNTVPLNSAPENMKNHKPS